MKFQCPTCGYVLPTQPLPIVAAGHECPKRPTSRKVATFVKVRA